MIGFLRLYDLVRLVEEMDGERPGPADGRGTTKQQRGL